MFQDWYIIVSPPLPAPRYHQLVQVAVLQVQSGFTLVVCALVYM